MYISNSKSNRLLELRGITSKMVAHQHNSILGANHEVVYLNHYSKRHNSKFSSLWDTTLGVAPWRQGTTDSHRLGSVGQKGSYPDIQSLIDIQESPFEKSTKICEHSSFLYQLPRVLHEVNKSVLV